MVSQRNKVYTLNPKQDAKEPRQWKCNKVGSHQLSSESQVTSTPRSQSACNPAQHTTPLPPTECQMATPAASDDAAAAQRRAHSRVRGATGISSVTSRTARWKRGSWGRRISGIDGTARVYDVCLNKGYIGLFTRLQMVVVVKYMGVSETWKGGLFSASMWE